MAIVKAKYVRGKPRIKAHLRYITHRRGMEGERMTRLLFGKDGPLSKQQIYAMIDASCRGAVFHKFVINFHPVKEDTRKDLNLWELTRKTLETIKTQFGDSVPFVATIHDDHTLLRHIHGFFIVEGRLPKEEFAKIKGLWKVASAEVWLQRRRLDRMHRSPRYKKLLPLLEKYKRKHQQGRGRRMRDIRMQPACQHCGFGSRSGIPAYLITCPVCKQWLTQRRQIHLELGRGRRLHR
jgi:predicted Zn-ribbon and HTH transcriptional regulator